ncbi:MAG TPA: energy transducer TonB [Acidobacteriaceae bacterium]|nr:energy transducer TonB [Acidobacteriaceae bacterium]
MPAYPPSAIPQQPGAPQQPGQTQPQQPNDPNAVPGAPPAFVPGLGAGNDAGGTQPRVIRVSGGVISGNLVHKVEVTYPEDAKAAHVEGTVVMSAHIGKDGHVGSLAVVSGPQLLQEAAVNAVKQWVYRPYLLNGEAVEVATTIIVNFNLR